MFKFTLPKFAMVHIHIHTTSKMFVHLGNGEFVGAEEPLIIEGVQPMSEPHGDRPIVEVEEVDELFVDGGRRIIDVTFTSGEKTEAVMAKVSALDIVMQHASATTMTLLGEDGPIAAVPWDAPV